jgi:hypothetical protein
MKHTFKRSNWSKITPKVWKRIGDTAIYAQPLVFGMIMQMPVPDVTIKWITFGASVLLTGIKVICKFFGYENNN